MDLNSKLLIYQTREQTTADIPNSADRQHFTSPAPAESMS